MPDYVIEDNVTGRQLVVTGPEQPTEEEAQAIFAELAAQEASQDRPPGPGQVELGPQSVQLPGSPPAAAPVPPVPSQDYAQPVPAPPPAPTLDTSGLTSPEQAALGVGDALLAVGSAGAAEVAGGLAGAAGAATGGVEQGVETLNTVRDFLSYRPRTEHGRQILQATSDFLSPVTEPIEQFRKGAGDWGYEQGGPAAGAAAQTIPELVEFLLGGVLINRIMGRRTPRVDTADILTEAAEAPSPEQAAVVLERRAFDEVEPPRPSLEERQPVPGGPVPASDRKADLATGVPSNETAGYRIDDPSLPYEQQRVVPAPASKRGLQQGLRPGTVSSIQAANPATRAAMARSLDELEKGIANDTYAARYRPADVAGEVVLDDVKLLRDINKKAGREVKAAAKGLAGERVSTVSLLNDFLEEVAELGATFDPKTGKLVVSETGPLEKMKKAREMLAETFDKLARLGPKPDAFEVHQVKNWIDNRVDYGKSRGKPAIRNVDRIIKGMRSDINEALRKVSDEYAAANDKFSETRGALDDIQAGVGRKVDMSGTSAGSALGTALRRVLSNAQSRIPIRDAVDNARRVALKYGSGNDVDMDALLQFINVLEENFGSAAPNSFMHEIVKAGMQGARAKVDPLGGAMDAATGVWQFVNRQTDERLLVALRDMLEEQQPKPKPKGD